MRAPSEGLYVVLRAFVRPTRARYDRHAVGIHWISHTVLGTQQYCIEFMSSGLRFFGLAVFSRCHSGMLCETWGSNI